MKFVHNILALIVLSVFAFPQSGGGEGKPTGPSRPAVSQWVPEPVIWSNKPKGIGLPNAPTNGFTIHNTLVSTDYSAAIIGYYQPTMNMVVSECVVEGKWTTNNNSGKFGNWTKWGMRLYDVSDLLVIDTVFRNIGNEHGAYLNIVGDVTFRLCHFYNIGSQGLQFVYRPFESSNPEWVSNPGRVLVDRCVFQQVTSPWGPGWPAMRASFTISSHARDPGKIHKGQNLTIRRVFMEAEWPEFTYSGKQAQSYGAVMCEWHDQFVMRNAWIDYTNPETRPVVQLHNLNSVIIGGTYIKEGLVSIKGTPLIRIENCTGNARLQVDGVEVGLLSDGYTKG